MTRETRPYNPRDTSCETVLFDLDDCLYYRPEMSRQVSQNIQKYMVEFLHIPEDEVEGLSRELYAKHGTTLCGLVNALGKKIDYTHWHQHVHWNLDYESYLQPDTVLKNMLQQMPVRKFVFTNADRKHALICLSLLGLSECFNPDDIICFETLLEMAHGGHLEDHVLKKHGIPDGHGIVCKPQPLAFELAMARVGGDVTSTVFFDDSARNIASAHTCGIYSVLVNPNRIDSLYDMHIKSIHDVPYQLPWLTDVSDGINHSAEKVDATRIFSEEETPVTVQA